MVNRCVVFGCGGIPIDKEVSVHEFPKSTVNSKQRNLWEKFVRKTRDKWRLTGKAWICSQRFEKDDFENWIQFTMGLAKKLVLKKGVRPSVYPTLSTAVNSQSPQTPHAPPTRSVIRKREVRRIMTNAAADVPALEERDNEPDTSGIEPAMEEPRTRDMGTQYEPPIATKDVSCQANIIVKDTKAITHVKRTQTDPKVTALDVTEPAECDTCKWLLSTSGGPITSTPKKRKLENVDQESMSLSSTIGQTEADVTYQPSFIDESDTNSEHGDKEEKYIVYKSCLMKLFTKCPHCGFPCEVTSYTRGSLLVVKTHCQSCVEDRAWLSQPMMGDMPAGNIQISAAILFTGASYTRGLTVFDAAGILCIKPSTYKDHKRLYLEPTIWTVWVNHQQKLCDQLQAMPAGLVLGGDGRADSPGHSAKYGSYTTKLCDQLQAMPAGLILGGDGRADSPGHSAKYGSYTMKLCDQLQAMPAGLILGGDGRADSPGHSAKYGSYTMMELRINKVIDIQLVQCNEVGCSNAMEKQGFIRSMKKLEELGLAVHTLITVRHPQIQKYARENLSTVNHFYDVWHVAKGFVRRVERLTKKGCPELQPWLKSISNHMYWCAASSGNDPALIVAKWQSLGNHLQNKHANHGSLFPKCLHQKPLEGAKPKKWLKPATQACDKIVALVNNTRVLKDVRKLSPGMQTSNVEAFHSLIIQFAPKSVHFSFLGMLTRLSLSALHYNENANRKQAVNKDGEPVFVIRFPKFKKGGYTLQAKKVDPTFEYVDELMAMLFDQALDDGRVHVLWEAWQEVEAIVPANMCSQYERPNKIDVIKQQSSRFAKSNEPCLPDQN